MSDIHESKCPHCKEGQLYKIDDRILFGDYYLQCEKCDSTYYPIQLEQALSDNKKRT